uniref:Uncharacterized protein n=1 Tax=Amphimedon queenslandica TaxID=400682 RepID=A0A1X7U8Y3_AMPQE
MHLTKPCYTVSCWRTVIGIIDSKYADSTNPFSESHFQVVMTTFKLAVLCLEEWLIDICTNAIP